MTAIVLHGWNAILFLLGLIAFWVAIIAIGINWVLRWYLGRLKARRARLEADWWRRLHR